MHISKSKEGNQRRTHGPLTIPGAADDAGASQPEPSLKIVVALAGKLLRDSNFNQNG